MGLGIGIGFGFGLGLGLCFGLGWRRRDHERDRRVALLVESAHHLARAGLVAMEGRAHHGGLLRG